MANIIIGEVPAQDNESMEEIARQLINKLLANPGKSVSTWVEDRRMLMVYARKEAALHGYYIDRKLSGSLVTIWATGRDLLVNMGTEIKNPPWMLPNERDKNNTNNPFSRYNIVINVMKVVVPGEWVELREVIERLELPEQKRTHATRLLVGTTLIKAGWVRSQRRPERGGNPRWGYSFEGQITAGPLAADSIMAAAKGLIESGRYWFHVDDILRVMGLTGSLAERTQIARTLESKGTYRRRKGRKDDSRGIKLWGYRVAPMMSDRVAYEGVA